MIAGPGRMVFEGNICGAGHLNSDEIRMILIDDIKRYACNIVTANTRSATT